ncbi:conserved hypothetical protein [Tenacibaculum litoreum]|uniref:hypothetical protein n=1 Tax=Tenacibaculum litoreum TaxID=321269 RepID=UPI0038932061
MNKLFTLLEKNNTKELHLFRSKRNSSGDCYAEEEESICKKMHLEERKSVKFSCLDKYNARKECAEIGEEVCGTCVSALYSKY